MRLFRIHGDNIVECERIAKLILNSLSPNFLNFFLISPSTIAIELKAHFDGTPIHWHIELLPGFNKNSKKHWEGNIFDALHDAGSFFDETPDAIITEIIGNTEKILLSIEFCSALQAGNQAWQRSARAFSTGRTGCPYLYIVDFVKYELDRASRERKNLRFPNAAVPYSYVNYSKATGNFISQLYTKSEEFDKNRDSDISKFNESNFGNKELSTYLIKLMLGLDTQKEEKVILKKNMNVVQFLANHFNNRTNFTSKEWKEIYLLKKGNIVDYAVSKSRFSFHKTIASKSHHGASTDVLKIIDKYGIGLASQDIPFGVIPSNKRKAFTKDLSKLYPQFNLNLIQLISDNQKHLIVAILKGFKPKGDDNRPDRGLLPFATMLTSTDTDILTYIYGPLIENNLKLLDTNPLKLTEKNGLWRSIFALSNYVILDVPVLSKKKYSAVRLYNTKNIKKYYGSIGKNNKLLKKQRFSSTPLNYGEDDVDTGIHYLFSYILKKHCFEGMCNPPGGDWSGFSVIDKDYENRWLSLPRVSDVINGKRPDHVVEIFGIFKKPLLLSIESKEKSSDLEIDVGTKLVTYIKRLMDYVPSAICQVKPTLGSWMWGYQKIDFNNFEVMSAAAYMRKHAESPTEIFKKNCELLFVMDPVLDNPNMVWDIEIIPSSKRAKIVKKFILDMYAASGDKQLYIH